MTETTELASLDATVTRLGGTLEPDDQPSEAWGICNPAAARTRDGRLLLFPRVVAAGNISRIARVEVGGDEAVPAYARDGYALEPQARYEKRNQPGGYGCEDPRVTFVPALDAYVMTYTAFGPLGPRIAIALSQDGRTWERLGLVDFSAPGLPCGDDKDAAFFPEPVISPAGVKSFAFYHRPMLHVSAVDGRAAVPLILALPPEDREAIRIAYVPYEPAMADRSKLLQVAESVVVLAPEAAWGRIKTGAGTPPVRVAEGWLSMFHGVDAETRQDGSFEMRYSAGIVIHDAERPDVIRYRSPEPVLAPQTDHERNGVVNDVVFPTGIVVLDDAKRSYDIYYGMADRYVGRVRLDVGASTVAGAESAA